VPVLPAAMITQRPVQLGLGFDLDVWPTMRGWDLEQWQVLVPAALAALEQSFQEFSSSRCACTARKMRNTPFCRECMEVLKRAKLLRQFNIFTKIVDMAGGTWKENIGRAFLRHYDLCRDYLLNTRPKPAIKKMPLKRRAA